LWLQTSDTGVPRRRQNPVPDAVRHVVTTARLDQRLPFLRAGMSVEVDVIVSRLAHVLAIDPAAIRRYGDGAPYVFAVQAGIARKRPIVLGPMDSTTAVVRSGVTAGETVVAERDPAIVDGTRVRR
jgi:hypothetical protein